jgi:hypothetical protein
MRVLLSWPLVLAACLAVQPPASGQTAPGQTAPVAAGDSAEIIAAPAPRANFGDFRPSRHGFAFVNSFSGSPLPVSLGALEQRLNVPNRFGLCGGMSFAAADFYLAGRSLRAEITSQTPPAQGTEVYRYLYQRQSASLGPMAVMATKFLDWMQTPESGPDGTHVRTDAELPAITGALGRGEGVMIGLVLVGADRSLAVWNNHQVLAYAVASGDDASHPTIRIYDPNYPDQDDVVLRWVPDEADPRWERFVPRDGRAPRITRVRGFFQMPYEPGVPPVFAGDQPAPAGEPNER